MTAQGFLQLSEKICNLVPGGPSPLPPLRCEKDPGCGWSGRLPLTENFPPPTTTTLLTLTLDRN